MAVRYRGHLRVPGRLRCVRSRRRGGLERTRGLLSGLWAGCDAARASSPRFTDRDSQYPEWAAVQHRMSAVQLRVPWRTYDVCDSRRRGGARTAARRTTVGDYGPWSRCRRQATRPMESGDPAQCVRYLQHARQDIGAHHHHHHHHYGHRHGGLRPPPRPPPPPPSGGTNGHVDYCRDYGPCRCRPRRLRWEQSV